MSMQPIWSTTSFAFNRRAVSMVLSEWRHAFSRSRLSSEENLKRFGLAWLTPIGSGQKLCSVEILISPASTASMIPGSRLMRMPWLSSAYSKPRSRISRSMARPSVWRCEFQQVESECIKKAECVCELDSTRPRGFDYLQIGIAGAQHGRKPGHLHFATAPFARLFIMPVVAHFLQDALAVDLFLQSPQRFFHRFAHFEFDLCQRRFTSSPGPPGTGGQPLTALAFKSGARRVVLLGQCVNVQRVACS